MCDLLSIPTGGMLQGQVMTWQPHQEVQGRLEGGWVPSLVDGAAPTLTAASQCFALSCLWQRECRGRHGVGREELHQLQEMEEPSFNLATPANSCVS